jgi:hypothetical protein
MDLLFASGAKLRCQGESHAWVIMRGPRLPAMALWLAGKLESRL